MENLHMIYSYPRSGANWLRYIIEYNTNFSTSGVTLDTVNRRPLHNSIEEINSGNKSTERNLVHDHWIPTDGCFKMIFVLRDYKECIVRHNIGNYEMTDGLFEKCKTDLEVMYIEQLAYYHYFTGPKMLIRYEDLIDPTKMTTIVERVQHFLDNPLLGDGTKKNFINELPTHIEKSKNFYNNFAPTISDTVSPSFHVNKLSQEQIDIMESIVQLYPELYENYLKEYTK